VTPEPFLGNFTMSAPANASTIGPLKLTQSTDRRNVRRCASRQEPDHAPASEACWRARTITSEKGGVDYPGRFREPRGLATLVAYADSLCLRATLGSAVSSASRRDVNGSVHRMTGFAGAPGSAYPDGRVGRHRMRIVNGAITQPNATRSASSLSKFSHNFAPRIGANSSHSEGT
jgi:hypothetical protein